MGKTGRTIVKFAALAIIAVVAFFMGRWFGYKAAIGLLLAMAAFAIYAGVSRQEQDEELIDDTIFAICGAIQEMIKDNDIDLSEAVKQKIREAVEKE